MGRKGSGLSPWGKGEVGGVTIGGVGNCGGKCNVEGNLTVHDREIFKKVETHKETSKRSDQGLFEKSLISPRLRKVQTNYVSLCFPKLLGCTDLHMSHQRFEPSRMHLYLYVETWV